MEVREVNIGVAVSLEEGLTVPVLVGAERMSLEQIATNTRRIVESARAGKLEGSGQGVFTISNMGMNPAIERFTAVINPPQAAILAVGTTKKVAVPLETEEGTSVSWDEQIVVTGSFDHRVVDGAVGGEWIREFKKVVENPLELLL